MVFPFKFVFLIVIFLIFFKNSFQFDINQDDTKKNIIALIKPQQNIIENESDLLIENLNINQDSINSYNDFPLINPLLNTPNYCQINIENVILDQIRFNYCPLNPNLLSVNDSSITNEERLLGVRFDLVYNFQITSSCSCSVNITLNLNEFGFSNESYRIDLVQLSPGINSKQLVYLVDRISNPKLFSVFIPFLNEECSSIRMTNMRNHYQQKQQYRIKRENFKNLSLVRSIRFDIGSVGGILSKVPLQIVDNSFNLGGDIASIITAPYVGIPIVGLKTAVNALKAFFEAVKENIILAKYVIEFIEGTRAPLEVVYQYLKTFRPLFVYSNPILIIANGGSNPIAPVVDSFIEIFGLVVYPPITDSIEINEEKKEEIARDTSKFIGDQMSTEQKQNFCNPDSFDLYFNACTSSQSISNCALLYSTICIN